MRGAPVNGPVEPAQTEWELEQMLNLFQRLKLRRVLEIGVYEGGTLWHWLQPGVKVVAVDDTMRPPGPDTWYRWADDAQAELTLLHGSSHDSEILEQVAEHAPYGLVLIDADHTYEAARLDWENFAPMVEPEGIVCLHDILPRLGYGVDVLWQQIKTQPGARTIEIVEAGNVSPNGIGVAWM